MSTYGSIREDVKAYLGDMGEDDLQDVIRAHDVSGRPSSLSVLRTYAGMTQKQLADLVGVSQGRLSEWETGRREMSATTCWKIAKALGVAPGMIVEAAVALSEKQPCDL